MLCDYSAILQRIHTNNYKIEKKNQRSKKPRQKGWGLRGQIEIKYSYMQFTFIWKSNQVLTKQPVQYHKMHNVKLPGEI